MKFVLCLFIFLLGLKAEGYAQRKLPAKTKKEKAAEKQAKKSERQAETTDRSLIWDTRQFSRKNKANPGVSPWHSGTAGILPSHQAEISLFQPSRLGFSSKTEWLFRIAEEPFLPNIGLKHQWWGSRRLVLSTEHTVYYMYPLLKVLQHTAFKELVPDSVKIRHGGAMRNELLFSWLMNPRVEGCPGGAEKILTFRGGAEFYLGKSDIQPFDYAHTLYHTQLLDDQILYYGGLQLDSYFSYRFRYSLNSLFYSVDFTKDYAVEANLRVIYRLSPRLSLSLVGKGAYLHIDGVTRFTGFPLLDLTYFVRPDRVVRRGNMFKSRRR